jgi:riboflavin kinase/FMN adenylyltransferase
MATGFRIFRSLEEANGKFGPAALTIGNFDGVHAGHRLILRRVREVASRNGWTPSVLTFDPHPAKIVAPDRSPRLMTTPEQRCHFMEQEGIRQVLILPFTPEVAQIAPERFVREILVESLDTKAVLVGENFRFGHKHAGDTRLLRELGEELGFAVEVIPAVKLRGAVVSSSEIRRLIERGDVSRACRMLERPFSLEGDVVRGHGIGAKQTVPTLNLSTTAQVLPAIGVYVTRTQDPSSRHWPSVTNVGYRPTFGGSELSIETFLLAPLEGPAPQRIRVDFLRRLREEKKFANPEELKAQILRDVRRTQAYFRRVPCHNLDSSKGDKS